MQLRGLRCARVLGGVLVAALVAGLVLPGVASASGGTATARAEGSMAAGAGAGRERTFADDHVKREALEEAKRGLTASVTYPLSVITLCNYLDGGGDRWLDGIVENPNTNPGNLGPVVVFLEWQDASHNVVDDDATYAITYTLPLTGRAIFSFLLEQPAGATHYHVEPLGAPTTLPRYGLTPSIVGDGSDAESRYWDWRVTNDTGVRVVGSLVTGWEDQRVTATDTPTYVDVCGPEPYPTRLAPGESIVVRLRGYGPLLNANPVWGTIVTETQPEPGRITVYRFYKPSTGTHFYTASEVEKADVMARLAGAYKYEGPSYAAYGAGAVGTRPLYRFYNTRTGTHFYTASEDEAENVIDTLSHVYNFEGIAYYVANGYGSTSGQAYRFYNRRTGVHFYTSSEVEKNTVLATLSHVYTLEGPSYYVPLH